MLNYFNCLASSMTVLSLLLLALRTDDPEVKARIQYVIATLAPQRVRGPQELSNEAMQSLHASLRTTSRDVELRTIKRNARGTPGYALVVRFPQEDTAEPSPAPTVKREKTNIERPTSE